MSYYLFNLFLYILLLIIVKSSNLHHNLLYNNVDPVLAEAQQNNFTN